ncbi:MAG TPA: hypothetical protein VKX45_14745 [Bryobacteraceae bacterium]|jgi:hypothetical protein|nr:hypothetical protein [Bryobacteraceae bacterium]
MTTLNAQPAITAASPLPWLEVRTAHNPDFETRLTKTPHPENITLLRPFLLYSFTVTNAGQETIVALNIRFEVDTASGHTAIRNFFYQTFNQSDRPVMPPGKTLLFTGSPQADAIAGGSSKAKKAAGGGYGDHVKHGDGNDGASPQVDPQALQILSNAKAIRASIDLAITADGRTAGANLSKVLEDLAQQQQAYADLRQEALFRAQNPSITDSAIADWLRPLSEAKLILDPATMRPDPYTMTQKNIALAWLGMITAGRRAELTTRLSALTPEQSYLIVNKLKKGALQ